MRVLERRLRRFEEGLLPPPETAESRRLHEIVLGIRRARAARLGLPEPEDVPAPAFRPGMLFDTPTSGNKSRFHNANPDCIRQGHTKSAPAIVLRRGRRLFL